MAENDDLLDQITNDAEAAAATEEQVVEQPEAEPEQQQRQGKQTAQERIQQLVHERNELREDNARRDERLQMIQERMDALAKQQAPAAEEAPEPEIEIPDFNEDPQANINARFQRLEGLLEKAITKTDETAQTAQQSQTVQQLNDAVRQDVDQYAAEHPDIHLAQKYANEVRLGELTDMGIPEIQARQMITAENLQMSAVALQNGKRPAEVIYARAKRWGYQPEVGEQTEGKAEEVDLENAESLGGGGMPSVTEMMDMDEDEFDAAWQDLGYGKKMS